MESPRWSDERLPGAFLYSADDIVNALLPCGG